MGLSAYGAGALLRRALALRPVAALVSRTGGSVAVSSPAWRSDYMRGGRGMLQSVHNFRAVSGYRLEAGGRLRAGMLYRSGALETLSSEEGAWLIDTARIATVLDLRHPEEVAGLPPHALAERVVRLSFFPERNSMRTLVAEVNGLYGEGVTPERYLHFLGVSGEPLVRAFSLLARKTTYPLLVHCVAGKDRTGLLVALLMELLGAADEDIAHEYGLSEAATDRLIAYLRASGRRLQGSEPEIRARLATPPERMARFVALLRETYGGARAYLERHGVERSCIEEVRRLLLEA